MTNFMNYPRKPDAKRIPKELLTREYPKNIRRMSEEYPKKAKECPKNTQRTSQNLKFTPGFIRNVIQIQTRKKEKWRISHFSNLILMKCHSGFTCEPSHFEAGAGEEIEFESTSAQRWKTKTTQKKYEKNQNFYQILTHFEAGATVGQFLPSH